MELSTLEKINNQLKDEGKKFTLVDHRGKFKLRGTFMFENGTKKRAYINLELVAEEGNTREAKKRADMIFYSMEDLGYVPNVLPHQKEVIGTQSKQITVEEGIDLFIEDWWNNRSEYKWWEVYGEDGKTRDKKLEKARRKIATIEETRDLNSWQGINPYLNKLRQIKSSKLNIGSLYEAMNRYTKPNSRGRKEAYIRYKKIVELAKRKGFDVGGDTFDLEGLRGRYVPKKKPNFTEKELYKYIVYLGEKLPKWKWCFGAMYVWGVRPSETFGLTPNESKTAHVFGLKEELEGLEERTALASPVEVIEELDLFNIDRPWTYNGSDKKYDAMHAKQLVNGWGEDLRELINEDDNLPKFTLYAIRHAYARRLLKSNLSTAGCAESMGHDERIFKNTYLSSIKGRDMEELQKLL